MPAPTTPAAIIIENARWRDLPAIAEVQRRSFRRSLAYKVPVLFLLWMMPFVTFRVARQDPDESPVGCMIADTDNGSVRIMNIAVHPDARRQRIGTLLMEDIVRQLPKGNIVLMVEEPNRGAQSLYRGLGFSQTGFRHDYYGRNRHGIEMTLHRGPQKRTTSSRRRRDD